MFQSLLRPSSRYLLTYLLTPWCRVLLEKLTGLQLVKKFPAFHGTRRFITALTSVRHLSLSWVSPIQSIYPHPTSWRSILILSTHLPLGSYLLGNWQEYLEPKQSVNMHKWTNGCYKNVLNYLYSHWISACLSVKSDKIRLFKNT
jgi:hypothetical protein